MAMCHQKRNRRSLFLGERQELSREIATDIAIERHIVRDPDAIEDRKQQQRVFGRLSQRFGLLDKQLVPARWRLCFGCRIAFDVHESV